MESPYGGASTSQSQMQNPYQIQTRGVKDTLFHSNYYQMRLPWGIGECLSFPCEGRCVFDIYETDQSFSSKKKVGAVDQKFSGMMSSAAESTAYLIMGKSKIAKVTRPYKCCSPLCAESISRVTINKDTIGSIKSVGCCSLDTTVFGPREELWFNVKMCCWGYSCGQEMAIYDAQNNQVGRINYVSCTCCEFILDIQLPAEASPDQRLMLMLTAHFLENLLRERHHRNKTLAN